MRFNDLDNLWALNNVQWGKVVSIRMRGGQLQTGLGESFCQQNKAGANWFKEIHRDGNITQP